MQIMNAVIIMQMICTYTLPERSLYSADIHSCHDGMPHVKHAVKPGNIAEEAQELLLV